MAWKARVAQAAMVLITFAITAHCETEPSIVILSVYSASSLKPYKTDFMELNLKLREEYCQLHGYLCLTVDHRTLNG